MSLRLQEKLLRLIEYGEFEKLGSTKTQSVDVRVIAATNANLVNMSQEGEFRADLLDRLTFDVIQVPPLRERHEDVEELAHFFAIKLSTELMWDYFSGFTENALNILKSHSWPGNIRELKNVVERSVYRWGDQDLPVDKIIINPFENNYSFDPPNITPSHPQHTHSSQSFLLDSNLNLKEQTQQLHIHLVKEALKNNQHNQKNAASQLGLSYDQIRGLIRKYHLNL